MESAASKGTGLYVSSIVLCEVVWVLEAAYRFSRTEIASALDALLRTAQLTYSDKDLLWRALADFREGPGDFADYVIGREGSARGCRTTVTFDRVLPSSPLFEVV